MRYLKVAAVQAGVDPRWSRGEWLAHLRWQLAVCAEEGTGLVVFPAWTGCYRETYPQGFSWSSMDELLGLLGGLAREAGVYLVPGTIPVREKEKIYLRSFLFSPTGRCLGFQDQLCPPPGYTPGKKIEIFSTLWGRIGLLLDRDAFVPEIGRIMAQRGVEVICHPVGLTPSSFSPHHGLPQVVEAYGLLGVEAPLVGSFLGRSYQGPARILLPRALGHNRGLLAVAEDPTTTTVITAGFDLDDLLRFRSFLTASYPRPSPEGHRLAEAYRILVTTFYPTAETDTGGRTEE